MGTPPTVRADWIHPESLVESDDEGYGVTYSLWIDGVLGTSGYRPNGPDGDEAIFNVNTGEIQWVTTNAAVTMNNDGVTPDRPAYVFAIQADDGTPVDNLSPVKSFDVRVFNDPTGITDHPADQNITEDVLFQYDIEARDLFTVTVVNKPPVFTTEPPGDPVVVPATLYLTYDADATDDGQHDWRGDDRVTYSILEGPGDITINPETGLIHWQTSAVGQPCRRSIYRQNTRGRR